MFLSAQSAQPMCFHSQTMIFTKILVFFCFFFRDFPGLASPGQPGSQAAQASPRQLRRVQGSSGQLRPVQGISGESRTSQDSHLQAIGTYVYFLKNPGDGHIHLQRDMDG